MPPVSRAPGCAAPVRPRAHGPSCACACARLSSDPWTVWRPTFASRTQWPRPGLGAWMVGPCSNTCSVNHRTAEQKEICAICRRPNPLETGVIHERTRRGTWV
eukprot:6659237-Pyramimonas_sp.AAC.1